MNVHVLAYTDLKTALIAEYILEGPCCRRDGHVPRPRQWPAA